MNVKNIADTYTNLGRMGRGQSRLPQPGEDFPLNQSTGNESGIQPEPLEINPAKAGLQPEETLSLQSAKSMTLATADLIVEKPESKVMGLHDVYRAHMIPGRYV